MKREDLKALNLEDTAIDAIMALHGKDIETHKANVSTAQTEAATLKSQLAEANKQIEGFKGMDIESVKKTADDYKTKFETAQTEHAAALLKIKQDNALDKMLKEKYKVKESELVAVKAHLKSDKLKFSEEDESFVGLDEQVNPLKENHAAYFADSKEPPRIVTGVKSGQPADAGTFASAISERLATQNKGK